MSRARFIVIAALFLAAGAVPSSAQDAWVGASAGVSQGISVDLNKSNGFLSFDGEEFTGIGVSSDPSADPAQARDHGCFFLRINSTIRFACGTFNINFAQPLMMATVTGSVSGCSVNLTVSIPPTSTNPPYPEAGEGASLSPFYGYASAGGSVSRSGTATGSWSCSGVGSISGGTGYGALSVGAGGGVDYYVSP